MKKLIVSLLALAMCAGSVFALSACGGDKKEEENKDPDNTEQTPGGNEDSTGGNNDEDTPSGTSLFVMEFEDVDFTGKIGAGLSGSTQGLGMIQASNGADFGLPESVSASNGHYVSYTYSENQFEFTFTSDKATEVSITLRLNSEIGSVRYDSKSLGIVFNDEDLQYSAITVSPGEDPTGMGLTAHCFTDYKISVKGEVKAGENTLVIETRENTLNGGSSFAAPLFDCIKLTPDDTSAKLEFTGKVEGNY